MGRKPFFVDLSKVDQEPWFVILSTNRLDYSITVAIRGNRYEYFLDDCHVETAMRNLRPLKFKPGQQLAWLKKHSKEVKKLGESI